MTGVQEQQTYTLEQVFFPLLALFATQSPTTGIKVSASWLFDLVGDLRRMFPDLLKDDFGGDEEFELMKKLESRNGPFMYFLCMGPPASWMHLPEYLQGGFLGRSGIDDKVTQRWMARFDAQNQYNIVTHFDKGMGKVFLSSVDRELLELLQPFVDAYMPTVREFQEPCAIALI